MDEDVIVGSGDGVAFEDGPDHGRVIVFGSDTRGAYSLLEWTVASRPTTSQDFGAHQHADIEEVFIVRRGSIEFLLGDTVTTLHREDVVRVPAGTRHGYINRSGQDAEMLVMFSPGGFEELFVKYRTDQPTVPGDGFAADARRLFATEFET